MIKKATNRLVFEMMKKTENTVVQTDHIAQFFHAMNLPGHCLKDEPG